MRISDWSRALGSLAAHALQGFQLGYQIYIVARQEFASHEHPNGKPRPSHRKMAGLLMTPRAPLYFCRSLVSIARRLKQVVKVTRTQPLTPNSKHTFDERVSASSSSRIKLPNRYTTQLRSTRTSLPPCLRTSSLRSGRFTLRGDSFKGALCRVHMRFIHVLHQPNVKLPAQILDSPA